MPEERLMVFWQAVSITCHISSVPTLEGTFASSPQPPRKVRSGLRLAALLEDHQISVSISLSSPPGVVCVCMHLCMYVSMCVCLCLSHRATSGTFFNHDLICRGRQSHRAGFSGLPVPGTPGLHS